MTRLVLVRHGETIWHAENRFAGSSDIPLTARGHEQAERLARWAKGAELDAIWVSPQRRARETAAPAERATGMTARVDARLREIHFGRGEGLTSTEIEGSFPQAYAAFQLDPVGHHMPEGEDPHHVARRGIECFQEIARAYPDHRVLVVTHSTLMRLAFCELVGIPLSQYRSMFPFVVNGALMELGLERSKVSLLQYNSPAELVAEDRGKDAEAETAAK